jgi:hypothetical protein
VRVQLLTIVAAGMLAAVELPPPPAAVRRITWEDIAPVRSRLQAAGLTASTFDSRIAALSREAQFRVREGDMEHLIHYVLQSTRFTRLPPIEPAMSAKAFVEARKSGTVDPLPAPAVEARFTAFMNAVDSSDRDPRLAYFRALLAESASGVDRRVVLRANYLRVANFLYDKEFVQRSRPEAAAALYRTRGLSTDTAVESGYAVHVGLGVLKALDPSRRIRRVLIVGPGIDLAPRTGMLEAGPPESYQPWAVIDALVSLGLSSVGDLEVVGADINPRVVDHLRGARLAPPVLRLITGLGETAAVAFSSDYRDYFTSLGRSVGTIRPGGKAPAGHLAKTVTVSKQAAAILRAEPLNIVTERFDLVSGEQFDLVIATNILPYFGNVELELALANISAMLSPGGVLLHNELRPSLPEIAADAGMPVEQSRQVIVATVKEAPPLVDTVWLHRKAGK